MGRGAREQLGRRGQPDGFFDVFIAAMAKLGRIGIKTAADGEIRRVCSKAN
jgi:hypothetical protein